jgi:hypothetical protein
MPLIHSQHRGRQEQQVKDSQTRQRQLSHGPVVPCPCPPRTFRFCLSLLPFLPGCRRDDVRPAAWWKGTDVGVTGHETPPTPGEAFAFFQWVEQTPDMACISRLSPASVSGLLPYGVFSPAPPPFFPGAGPSKVLA